MQLRLNPFCHQLLKINILIYVPMRQLQLPVELLQLVFSYVSQHRYLPCSSNSDQRQDQGHEQWRGQDLSNPFAVVAEEEPCKDIKTCATVCSMWHASALWFLFRSPRLTEKPAIRRLIDMLSSAKLARTRWAAVTSAMVDGSNNSNDGNTSKVSNIYLSGKFILFLILEMLFKISIYRFSLAANPWSLILSLYG